MDFKKIYCKIEEFYYDLATSRYFSATKHALYSYITLAYATTFVFPGSFILLIDFLSSDFNLVDLFICLIFLPIYAFYGIWLDLGLDPIHYNINYTDLDIIIKSIIIVLSLLWICIFFTILSFVPRAEKRRKEIYQRHLQDLFLRESHISISELSHTMNVSNDVIITWLRNISPDYGIKRVDRHVKVEKKRILTDEEKVELMNQLDKAQEEVNRIRREDERRKDSNR